MDRGKEGTVEVTDTFQDPELEIIRLKRYETLVLQISTSYVELSYDKAKTEYLNIIQKCRKLALEDWEEGCDGLAMPFYNKSVKGDF
jgi:hypothetical protein